MDEEIAEWDRRGGLSVGVCNLLINSDIYFEEIKKQKNIILYSAGSKARQTIRLLEKKGIVPAVVCDGNEKLWGGVLENKYTIISYQQMRKKYDDYCIIIAAAIDNAVRIIADLKEWGESHPIYQCCNLFKVDTELLEFCEIEKREKRYSKIYDLLQDDISKEIFVEFINSKMTGSVLSIKEYEDGNTFFDPCILRDREKHMYVDVGAYTGDTICSFLKYAGEKYSKIIGIDAEKGNYEALKKFIKYGRIERVGLFNKALWSEKKIMNFYTITDNIDINYDSPNLYHRVSGQAENSILAKCKQKNVEEAVEIMEADILDNVLENECPTLIKINALAADLPILQGGEVMLRKYRPDIIMEYGVRPSYLLEEVEYLDNLHIGYSFYLRQKNIFGDSKTVLYAIGEETINGFE